MPIITDSAVVDAAINEKFVVTSTQNGIEIALKDDYGFRVFDSTQYLNKPDLSIYGIEPLNTVYSHLVWPNNQVTNDLPDEAFFQAQIEGLIGADSTCVLDIEHWDMSGPDVDESVWKYLKAYEIAKRIETLNSVGFYGVVPRRDYWRAIAPKDSAQYLEWEAENEKFWLVGNSVDALYPSLYTFYDDPAGWVTYAERNIEIARKHDKRVYAFIWPQYHDSNSSLGLSYIDPSFWMLQLETLYSLADGVVIWGGWDFDNNQRATWDDSAGWWIETQTFINDRGVTVAEV